MPQLRGLSTDETKTLLLKLGQLYKRERVKEIVENQVGQLETLRRLTEGVIRSIILLYEIFVDDNQRDAFMELEKILDSVTPLYKQRMDSLTPQQQEIVDLIALSWDAVGTREIAQKTKLAKLCRQAPYGKGTETVVDTDVRRTWELDPEQFQLTNPKWDALLATIIGDAQEELGLKDRKLTAHLYKLLLYEKGGFFLPHRDGEKLDRMVATLVIGLPSVYEGGELIVTHEGSHHEIAYTGAASGHELSYAAFYADCEHEVRPVRSGYRLCLVYNLTLAKSRGKKGIAAPTSGAAIGAVAKILRDGREDETREKLAVTLDHRYTQDGLTMEMLKGVDRARAEVLFEAAEHAGWVAHLALVTLWQSGSAEEDENYEYSRYRSRRGHWYDEDEEDDDEYDENVSEYEMGEIFDESLSINHWSDGQGNKVGLGEIRLDEDEIVSDQPLDHWDPSREEFEGYTGNAGMTLERWYHRAAVVIWPRERHFEVLCGAGTDASIGGLQPMVKQLKRAAKARRDEQRQACRDFAVAISGSPYTLVCTKTTTSYEAARQIHERDRENLIRLKALQTKIG